MNIESGFTGRLYAMSGVGDSGGRGRRADNKVVSVDTSTTLVLANNANRIYALLCNVGAKDVFLSLGDDDAILNSGIILKAGGGWALINFDMAWSGAIQGIADTTASDVVIVEVSIQQQTTDPNPGPGPAPGPQPRSWC